MVIFHSYVSLPEGILISLVVPNCWWPIAILPGLSQAFAQAGDWPWIHDWRPQFFQKMVKWRPLGRSNRLVITTNIQSFWPGSHRWCPYDSFFCIVGVDQCFAACWDDSQQNTTYWHPPMMGVNCFDMSSCFVVCSGYRLFILGKDILSGGTIFCTMFEPSERAGQRICSSVGFKLLGPGKVCIQEVRKPLCVCFSEL